MICEVSHGVRRGAIAIQIEIHELLGESFFLLIYLDSPLDERVREKWELRLQISDEFLRTFHFR